MGRAGEPEVRLSRLKATAPQTAAQTDYSRTVAPKPIRASRLHGWMVGWSRGREGEKEG